METVAAEAVQNGFSGGAFAGQLLSVGALIAAIGALYKKLGEVINQNFVANRENTQLLVGVIKENTEAMKHVAVVVSKCEK